MKHLFCIDCKAMVPCPEAWVKLCASDRDYLESGHRCEACWHRHDDETIDYNLGGTPE